ncbi:hypothetical protein [Brevibacillus massiliensis]|uniref:hypothetical protein n=1 Tax=Brevibacillus massiliensis TaxID=1118054 RepID=UPI0002E0054A|nr:hypothetical protein [Brevibacillus massiliensis]
MSYNPKLDWKTDDDVTESDFNRIEQGIADAHVLLEQFSVDIANLKNRVQLIESTFPDSFTHNLFTEELLTLDSIILTHGYYNEAQTRLEV